MKKNLNYKFFSYAIFLIAVILISFGYNSRNKNTSESLLHKIAFKDSVRAKIEFPDTVYINQKYNGKVKYYGLLDTITKDVTKGQNGIDRYILFCFTTTSNINYKINELRKMKLDTVGAIDNNTIPFYDVKFTKPGVNYIYGIINDHATIDTIKKLKKNDKSRYIENESLVSHKVMVISKATSGNRR